MLPLSLLFLGHASEHCPWLHPARLLCCSCLGSDSAYLKLVYCAVDTTLPAVFEATYQACAEGLIHHPRHTTSKPAQHWLLISSTLTATILFLVRLYYTAYAVVSEFPPPCRPHAQPSTIISDSCVLQQRRSRPALTTQGSPPDPARNRTTSTRLADSEYCIWVIEWSVCI